MAYHLSVVEILDEINQQDTPHSSNPHTPQMTITPVNQRLVEQGAAWVYRYHDAAVVPELQPAEMQAKHQRIGLWADDNPLAPWVWRQQHKKESIQ